MHLPAAARPRSAGEPAGHVLGRSRGGFTSKLHHGTDGTGLPLAVVLSARQAHESPYATRVLEAVRVRQRGPGVRGAVAPRYEELANNCLAIVQFSMIRLLARRIERVVSHKA